MSDVKLYQGMVYSGNDTYTEESVWCRASDYDAVIAERDALDATVRLLSKVQTKLIAELAAARKDAAGCRALLKRVNDAEFELDGILLLEIAAAMKEPT